MAHTRLRLYITKEFFLSFFLAFLFFFFIFFINQILLIAQEILLKNIKLADVMLLILYAIPQILLYTIPFSSLTAASMLIGDMSSNNEITALRSNGISLSSIFKPIILSSLILVALTFFVADVLHPYSMVKYRLLYSKLLQELPTMQLSSFKANKIGNMIVLPSKVEENKIKDILMFTIDSDNEQKIVNAKNANIEIEDIDNLVYKLNLNNPELFIYKNSDYSDYSSAKSKNMRYYLDFSNQLPDFNESNMGALTTKDLSNLIKEQKGYLALNQKDYKRDFINKRARIVDNYNNHEEISSFLLLDAKEKNIWPIDYNYQYYMAEYAKKFVLALANLFLVIIAFPISFIKVKNGRLIGFGLSMLIACLYWFVLFYSQLKIFDYAYKSAFIMSTPNIVIMLLSIVLLLRLYNK